MSTHDLGQAHRLANDIVFLHQGKLVEHTSADTFFQQPQTKMAQDFIAGKLLNGD
jgi:tungstate transport system ATP-binding protein